MSIWSKAGGTVWETDTFRVGGTASLGGLLEAGLENYSPKLPQT